MYVKRAQRARILSDQLSLNSIRCVPSIMCYLSVSRANHEARTLSDHQSLNYIKVFQVSTLDLLSLLICQFFVQIVKLAQKAGP